MKASSIIDKLGQFANVFNSLHYIMAIKAAFITLMPVIIVGAFSVLMSNMIFDSQNGLAYFDIFSGLTVLKPIATNLGYATLNFLTIGAVFLIAIELGRINGNKTLFPGMLAIICFISVQPTFINVVINHETVLIENVIAKQFTDTKSLFLGMFIAIFSVEVYSKLLTIERLKVKMPDSVPSNVSASFSALIPAIITTSFIATCGFVFFKLTGMYLYDAIYMVIQQPLESVIQSLPGLLILMFFAQLFWVIGIHGNQMVKPIREPLLLGAIMVNMNDFNQGIEPTNIITMPFWDVYMSIGGSGCTIGLLIAVYIAIRRKDMREITKLSTGPGIFNINEPIIFGMPIMLNPILAIPFIITPLITGTIGYIATSIGFAGKAVVMIPWTTPPIISAYLSTAGSIGAVITQIICIVIAIIIYLPFLKIAENRLNAQSKQNEKLA